MTDWTRDEVEATVGDYFAMLRRELAGERYSKRLHNESLQGELNGRSRGAVEFKHQNISAVLVNHRLPYISGYQPRQNYQQLLEGVVLEFLDAEIALFEALASGPVLSPAHPGAAPTRVDRLVEAPPEGTPVAHSEVGPGSHLSKIDFVRRDAESRLLGQLGEEWVLEFEVRRLHDQHARPDLARRVEWSSQLQGDGLGYDIWSFNGDESSRLIEVKTTGLGKAFPFLVTSNEVNVSAREFSAYRLYRVFEFAAKPRLYMLAGALIETCNLEPTQYRARVR